jgi:hypothetical protein
MKIWISNISDFRQSPGVKHISMQDRDDVLGDLRIEFSCHGRTDSYDRSLISIPLLISETLQFLDALQKDREATWTVYLSPVVDARLRGEEVIFSWASGRDFDAHIIDRSPASSLNEARGQLEQLASQYGRVV